MFLAIVTEDPFVSIIFPLSSSILLYRLCLFPSIIASTQTHAGTHTHPYKLLSSFSLFPDYHSHFPSSSLPLSLHLPRSTDLNWEFEHSCDKYKQIHGWKRWWRIKQCNTVRNGENGPFESCRAWSGALETSRYWISRWSESL